MVTVRLRVSFLALCGIGVMLLQILIPNAGGPWVKDSDELVVGCIHSKMNKSLYKSLWNRDRSVPYAHIQPLFGKNILERMAPCPTCDHYLLNVHGTLTRNISLNDMLTLLFLLK